MENNNIKIDSFFKDSEYFKNDYNLSVFIEGTRNLITQSMEYKEYNNMIVKNAIYTDFISCFILSEPFKLDEIIGIIIHKRLSKDEPITTFHIAQEYIDLLLHNIISFNITVGLKDKTMKTFQVNTPDEFYKRYLEFIPKECIDKYREYNSDAPKLVL